MRICNFFAVLGSEKHRNEESQPCPFMLAFARIKREQLSKHLLGILPDLKQHRSFSYSFILYSNPIFQFGMIHVEDILSINFSRVAGRNGSLKTRFFIRLKKKPTKAPIDCFGNRTHLLSQAFSGSLLRILETERLRKLRSRT